MLSHMFLRKWEIIPDIDDECAEVLATPSKLTTFGLARIDAISAIIRQVEHLTTSA